MNFSLTKVRCTGYQRIRQDRFGNKLIVAQVLWHAQFHMLQHGSIWTYMLNSICISIYFQPKSNLSYYRHKQEKYGLIKSEIRLPMKNQQNTFASTCHMHTSQTAPRRNLFPMRMASHRHYFLHFLRIHTKKRHTTETRK